MKLDPTLFRYITKEEFRVLTAVEMGMRNHELVPVPLIESIARLTRGSTFKILQTLLRHKLVAHDGKKYDGYRMTYHGYDFLALRALVMRGSITGVGRRLGVGKESDVHFCQSPDGEVLALKLHRLGRISFRAIKEKRDYLKHRENASWMYMAKLAAAKEYAYMKALKEEGFPVPKPIDVNRHCVVMSFVPGTPMFHLRHLDHPHHVLEKLMRLLVRLCRAGIIHGDFNEFNLMVTPDEKVTLIDFPQIIHLGHPNARDHFDRDVQSVCDFFRRRLGIEVERAPSFAEVLEEVAAAGGATSAKLAGVEVDGLDAADDALLVDAHERGMRNREEDPEGALRGEDDEGSDEDEESDEDDDNPGVEAFQQLLPAEGQEAFGDEDAAQDEGGAAADPDGSSDSSEGEASDGPGQVTISTGKKTRRRASAKEARKNLQKQVKQKPARANNQKVTQMRKARHEVKEYFE
mmetsp:Transcript_44590/g.96920  ORF Transcript_44590/g.96920 Transcript_44590/m.96920 type:complete len:463 (+) Transcript_44590:54-1442(+)